jgi:hypothetical membrane protein
VHPRGLTILLLACASVPVAYFGAQAAAAPFYPGYSLLVVSASDLGSDRSTQAWVLNAGAIFTGLLAALGSIGLAAALPLVSASRALSYALAACVASIGLASAWAGLHPLPHPQHDPGALGLGVFAAPFVSALVAFRVRQLRALRWPLLANLVGFALCAWVLSGAAGVSLAVYGGLAQKLVAAVCIVPPAAIALSTLRLLDTAASDA